MCTTQDKEYIRTQVISNDIANYEYYSRMSLSLFYTSVSLMYEKLLHSIFVVMVRTVHKQIWQRTIKKSIEFHGYGLHSGNKVYMRVSPSSPNTGIVFQHGDNGPSIVASIKNIPADPTRQQFRSQLYDPKSKTSFSTIEHFMAAISASRISNAHVRIYAEHSNSSTTMDTDLEVPILDGSSLLFLNEIQRVGILTQEGSKQNYIRIIKPIQTTAASKAAWFLPIPEDPMNEMYTIPPTLYMTLQVNFAHKGLYNSTMNFILNDENMTNFQENVAPARTFTFENEIQQLHELGYAKGGSIENAVIYQSNSLMDHNHLTPSVLNPGGERLSNEWVRHKVLDCIGDVALAGIPIHGYLLSICPGHALTHDLLRNLFADEKNYEIISYV